MMDQRIHELSKRRQQIWCEGGMRPADVQRITAELADLFHDRRVERAQEAHGSRKDIIRHARIEHELEKLMTTD